MTFLIVPLLALFSVLLSSSLLNLVPLDSWLLELNHNFGAYYLLLHAVMIPLGILLLVYADRGEELWIVTSVNILLLIYYLFPVVPLFLPTQVPEGDISCDRLYSTLFLQIETEDEVREADRLLQDLHPDILFLSTQKQNATESLGLLSTFKDFRHTIGAAGSELAIAAQVPLGQMKLADLGEDLPGALIVDLPGERVPHAALAIVAGVDPLNDQQLSKNMLIMRRGSAALRSLGYPTIAAVSLRMTPHSRLYRVFKEDDVFTDLFTGKGLMRTWSGRSQFIRFHFDQFFTQGTILSSGASTIRSNAFDHLPITSEVRFCR